MQPAPSPPRNYHRLALKIVAGIFAAPFLILLVIISIAGARSR